MPEKKFEKELQEDMGGLRFRPSDAVWQHIETSLRREKRKKRAIYFFTLIGLLLLGGGSYLAFDTGRTSTLADEPRSATSISQEAQPKEPDHSNKATSGAHDSVYGDMTSATTTVKPDYTPKSGKPGPGLATGSQTGASQKINRNNTAVIASVRGSKSPRGAQSRKLNTAAALSNQQSASPDEYVKAKSSDKQRRPATPAMAEEQYLYIDPAASNIDGLEGIRNEIAKQFPADDLLPSPGAVAATEFPLNKPTAAAKKSWQWGFVAGGGINDHVDELPRLVRSRTESMPAFSNSPQPGPAVNPVVPPSPVRSGMALKLGINAAYPLAERTRISAGITYAYMTTSMRVGTRYNDPVNFDSYNQQPVATNVVYRGPHDQSYTNQYHFVQLPLTFETQLNRSKSTRLSWSASLVPGYMISGSPLLYDTAFNGIYYKNNDGFKRFRLGAATGLNVAFGKPGKGQWSIGPEFYLDLRSLTKPSFGPRQYFINAGLAARFILPSRKK